METKGYGVACLVLFSCVLIAGIKTPAWGQSLTGTIVGDVRDASGNVIPGANVVLTNEATGVRTSITTNDVGAYTSSSMLPGVYDIQASRTGFKTYEATHVELRTSDILRHDIALEVGAVNQRIEVVGQAGAAELQKDSGDVSEVLDFQTVQEMPASTRKVLELVALTPGVTMFGKGGTNSQTLAFFSIGGNPGSRGATYLLDGVGNNWPRAQGDGGNMSVTNPPTESIEELRVVTNSYSAEFGQGIGGMVIMTTKSGTNALKGDAYFFGQNTALNARNFFSKTTDPIHYNNFGGVIGGPIKKNKTFFFYSIERELQYQSTPSVQTLATMAQRQGDFSQTFDAGGNLIPIYDPSTTLFRPDGTITRQQFPGNIIPSPAWDPLGARLLQNFIPPPNVPGTVTGANNFLRNRESVNVSRWWNLGRVDHDFTPVDKLYSRISVDLPHYPEKGAYRGLGANYMAADPDELYAIQSNRTVGIGYTKIISPTWLSDFRFGWVSFHMHFEANGDNPNVWDKNWAGQLGLQNLSVDTFPYFAPTGYYNFGGSGGDFGGRQELLYKTFRTFEFGDHVTHQMGKHSIRFGGDWIDTRAIFASRVWPSGYSTYDPLATALPGVTGTGNSIASLLLGRVATAEVEDEPAPDVRTWFVGTYLQDDWRIRQHLTLNLGIRYEYDTPKIDVLETQNLFDPKTTNPVCNCPGVIVFTKNIYQVTHAHVPWYGSQPLDFAPRVGFAWSPKGGNTVLRGGFGVYYAGIDYSDTMWDGPQAGSGKKNDWTQDGQGLNPAFALSQGFPAPTVAPLNNSWGAVPIGQAPVFAPEFWSGNTAAGVDNRAVVYTEQWNFGVQRSFGRNMLEVGYLGTVGRHLPHWTNWNQVAPDLMGPGNAQIIRPFPQFGNVMAIAENSQSSLFHALLISVRRHTARGLTFQGNYTYSKLYDDMSYTRSDYNREADYGPSFIQRRNNFVWSSVYEVPFGKGKGLLNHGVGSQVLGGWLLGAFVPIQSGQPMGFDNSSNTCNCYTTGTQGVNISGPLRYTPNWQKQVATVPYFDTSVISAPAPYTFGNAGAGILNPPGTWEIDLNATKKFAITERYAIEFRMDIFNLTNHVNFGAPNGTFGSPGFGMITNAGSGRLMQYAAKIFF